MLHQIGLIVNQDVAYFYHLSYFVRIYLKISNIFSNIFLFSFITPFVMSLFYLFLSKERIYRADMFSVKFMKSSKPLLCALNRISKFISLSEDERLHFLDKIFTNNGKTSAGMFLNNDEALLKDMFLNSSFIIPFIKNLEGHNPFSTHPLIEERIRILSLMSSYTFESYKNSFKKVTKRNMC